MATRRRFLGLAAATMISARTDRQAWAADTENGLPLRTLGHTGEKVSIVGVGGYHLARPGVSQEEGIRIVRTAIDQGINFLDNCWDYNDGESELRMGKALRDGYRQKAFLMTKIDGRNRATAANQINDSLQRLHTDRIDLLQFHEVIRDNDPGRIFAAGGALEAVLEARKAGKIRYIGFTGHKSPDIHLKMLATASAHQFTFDAVQMPLNCHGSPFQQLRGQGASRSAEAEHRGAGHEAHGRSLHFAEQNRDLRRVFALRHESADQRGNHWMRFP